MEQTPTRDSVAYWTRRHQPADHSESGLYYHGPDGDSPTLYEMMADSIANELVVTNENHGRRLADRLEQHNRLKVVDFLALHPHLWGYVRIRMRLARTPPDRVAEIREWLEAARRRRASLIEASKREALRLATRTGTRNRRASSPANHLATRDGSPAMKRACSSR